MTPKQAQRVIEIVEQQSNLYPHWPGSKHITFDICNDDSGGGYIRMWVSYRGLTRITLVISPSGKVYPRYSKFIVPIACDYFEVTHE